MVDKLKMNRDFGIIGIDEVGRGALAGPVAVAAVFLPKKLRFRKLKDSKRLSPKKREEWFRHIHGENGVFWTVAMVSPRIIDKINISKAANKAAFRACQRLIAQLADYQISKIYLDGGLYINIRNLVFNAYRSKTLIRGDEKINAIKLASIIAKVKRDGLMVRNHKKYPAYEFNKHKGYGTKIHFKAIKLNGVCGIHRITFLHNINQWISSNKVSEI